MLQKMKNTPKAKGLSIGKRKGLFLAKGSGTGTRHQNVTAFKEFFNLPTRWHRFFNYTY
jgi:hypothetical protein